MSPIQSYLTFCDPMDCSLPGSSVHGIFQARVLEWVAISFFSFASIHDMPGPMLEVKGEQDKTQVWTTSAPPQHSVRQHWLKNLLTLNLYCWLSLHFSSCPKIRTDALTRLFSKMIKADESDIFWHISMSQTYIILTLHIFIIFKKPWIID